MTFEQEYDEASPAAAELPRRQQHVRWSSMKIVPALVVAARRGEASYHPMAGDTGKGNGHHAGALTPSTDEQAGGRVRPAGAPGAAAGAGGGWERPFSAGRPYSAAFGSTMRTINLDDALDE